MKKIEITNDRLAAAVRTNDAGAAFKTAVDNGQARLALDILGDILPGLIARIDKLEGNEKLEVATPVVQASYPEVEINEEPAPKAQSKSTKSAPAGKEAAVEEV